MTVSQVANAISDGQIIALVADAQFALMPIITVLAAAYAIRWVMTGMFSGGGARPSAEAEPDRQDVATSVPAVKMPPRKSRVVQ